MRRVKKLILLLAMIFLVCSCAEITYQDDPGISATETEGGTTVGDQGKSEFQSQRQLEMQQMMQKRMMKGGLQGNKPLKVGP